MFQNLKSASVSFWFRCLLAIIGSDNRKQKLHFTRCLCQTVFRDRFVWLQLLCHTVVLMGGKVGSRVVRFPDPLGKWHSCQSGNQTSGNPAQCKLDMCKAGLVQNCGKAEQVQIEQKLWWKVWSQPPAACSPSRPAAARYETLSNFVLWDTFYETLSNFVLSSFTTSPPQVYIPWCYICIRRL